MTYFAYDTDKIRKLMWGGKNNGWLSVQLEDALNQIEGLQARLDDLNHNLRVALDSRQSDHGACGELYRSILKVLEES